MPSNTLRDLFIRGKDTHFFLRKQVDPKRADRSSPGTLSEHPAQLSHCTERRLRSGEGGRLRVDHGRARVCRQASLYALPSRTLVCFFPGAHGTEAAGPGWGGGQPPHWLCCPHSPLNSPSSSELLSQDRCLRKPLPPQAGQEDGAQSSFPIWVCLGVSGAHPGV